MVFKNEAYILSANINKTTMLNIFVICLVGIMREYFFNNQNINYKIKILLNSKYLVFMMKSRHKKIQYTYEE